jgi:hypothetical protein
MANCRLLYNNVWKAATTILTASSAELNLPVTNTQKRASGRRWRSTSIVTDQTIVADLGAADIPAQAFFIRGNNFTSAAVVKIQGNDSDSWDAPAFEATLSPVDNNMMGVFFDEQTFQYWRLLISDAANPDLYVEVGPIFLGSYFQPAVNYKIAGGQRTVVIQDQPGVWQYSFRTAEKESFETIRRLVGRALPFWFCEDPDDPNTTTRYAVATAWAWAHLYLTTWTLVLSLAEEI